MSHALGGPTRWDIGTKDMQTYRGCGSKPGFELPPEDVPALLAKWFQIINLWGPIGNPPWELPLALCDFRSVNSRTEGGDFVPTTLKYKD
ncbi:hypothetical protein FRC12_007117 [Ceratobasidium sp. 428]|nr:hypothetical protein FRC12_007117 [Ceratobasidium sp. 428]